MEFDEVLNTRRAIRRWKEEPVSQKDLEAVLEAAVMAPSWKNTQTRRYHVIRSADRLEEVPKAVLPPFNQNNTRNAPVLIVSTFKKDISGKTPDGWANELENGWGIYDLGLADENMLLKARDLGLGTLVMGIRDRKAIEEMLEIAPDEEVVSVIALGVPDIEPPVPARKGLDETVKYY